MNALSPDFGEEPPAYTHAYTVYLSMTDIAKSLVRKTGIEPARVTPLEPKSSASTNSATFACFLMAPIVA